MGLGVMAWSFRWLRRHGMALRALIPYTALAAYSVGSALAIGTGRLGFGAVQAVTSR